MYFTFPQALMLALFLESILYGISLVTSGISLRCFFIDSRGSIIPFRQVKRGMLAMLLFLFSVATVDVALAFMNDFKQLLVPANLLVSDLNSPPWVNPARVAFLCIQNMAGDLIWLYRCWIIFNRSWTVLLLPGVLFIATMVLSFFNLALQSLPLESPVFGGPISRGFVIVRLTTASYAVAFVTSLTITVLIIWRLWTVDREVSKTTRYPSQGSQSTENFRYGLRKVILIVIESGLMFTTTELFALLASAVESTVTYVAINMDVQVILISFNLIVIFSHISRESMYSREAISTNSTMRWHDRTISTTFSDP